MKILKRSLGMHLLIAIGLSLIINFSYLLVPIITEQGMSERGEGSGMSEHNSGVLHLTDDLHGYVVCDCEQRDSIYVSAWKVHTFKLQDGDHLNFTSRILTGNTYTDEQKAKAHPRLEEVIVRNGVHFDFDALYDRPSRTVEFVWQIGYYALLSFLFIVLFTASFGRRQRPRWHFVQRVLVALALACVAIYFAPVMSFKEGAMRIVFFYESDPRDHTYLIVLTKSLFTVAVTVLYANIYRLMQQRQRMAIENEHLKTENLATRYNMLMGQINPHFFFNSLNSLAMLIREKDDERALKYIDQLSYTFRYIIQSGQSGKTTLRDELAFAEAYAYLFKIRYADKLFFDFDVDDEYKDWQLPALSLQPLIGNAVKHNSITSKNPLHVEISVHDGVLEIRNKKHPKLDVEPSTGIGLDNLNNRWKIISGQEIEVRDEADSFVVRLPLERPAK